MEVDPGEFIRGAAAVLDVDAKTLALDTRFRDVVPNWSSLFGYGLIVWMDETYGFDCPVDAFQRADRLGDLLEMIRKHESA